MLFNRRNLSDTPLISTGIYASGDQLGNVAREIGAANLDADGVTARPISILAADKGVGVLDTLLVSELGTQKSAMDVFFFNALPTLTNLDNGAFAMAAAEWAKCIGSVNVATADYKSSGAQSIATVRNLGLALQGLPKKKSIWYIAVVRATPTYATTADLVFTFGFNLP